MDALATRGAAIHGPVDQAHTLDPDTSCALESRAATSRRLGRSGQSSPSGIPADLAALAARTPTGMLASVPRNAGAEPFYRTAPPWLGYAFRPSALPSTGRGYASASAPATPSDDYAFLGDDSLSIEEKLYRFMALTLKKGDQELVEKMNEYKRKKADGGGFLGLGNIFGDIFGAFEDLVTNAVKTLGGPAVGSALAAIGMPVLTPFAMKIVGDLAGQAFGRAAGGSGSGSGEEDEKLQMLELQRLVDKQNTMFSALSNVLKSTHEAQMTAVGNIR